MLDDDGRDTGPTAFSIKARWLFLCSGVSLVGTLVSAEPADTVRASPHGNMSTADTNLVWLEPLEVTSSRTRRSVRNAPASMSVITNDVIAIDPSQDFSNLLRRVPGVNVTQLSARDIQVVGRGSAGTLASSELVVVDGRTINLDFFGFVMWDLMPVDHHEVKQIEVMRSAGSAVWGANAMSGVVNIVTRAPKDMLGTSVVLGGGEFETAYARFRHAGARSKLGYKLSGSMLTQVAFARPTGTIPGTDTPYPAIENRGAHLPKVDVRVDYDQNDETTWTVSTGYAGTKGILHSGIGPFDIASGTYLAYGRAAYLRRDLSVNFFTNWLDGDAVNLLTVDASGDPVAFRFETQTYRLDVTNAHRIGEHNRLTYGFNARRSNYDISLAPAGTNRDEVGVYLQDELSLGSRVRGVAGVRWDNIEPIGSVWSPRASISFLPGDDHTFRLSWNRAYRAPSVINNYIELDIVNEVALPPNGTPFRFPSQTRGNPDLAEERVTTLEAAYLARFMRRFYFELAVYRNHRRDGLDFYPERFYSAANPPPGWPLPPSAVPPNTFPERFSYRNHGQVIDRGIEVSLQYFPHYAWSAFANYSLQADPQVRDILRSEISTPPKHRFNVGVAFDDERYFANANLNYVDSAFWVDVLDSRFWGPTESFAQLNAAVGARVLDGRAAISVSATNLFDARVQQHVFGDIIGRRIVGEIRASFR